MTYENAVEAAEFISSKYDKQPQIAVVLGSGLGAFAEELENAVKLPYEDIAHFARSTVEGHAGQLVLGEIEGGSVAVQQGRFHFYEGYDMQQVMFPMRVFGRMGIKSVILTNAAGSLNAEMKPGSLMLITDHINMMGTNPLVGSNDTRFGPRFPDMTNIYDRQMQQIAAEQGIEIGKEISAHGGKADYCEFLHRGVYCALSGPTYETPAEIRMLRLLGADAVGMSTVPEAIAARHQGMKVMGISCISNFAAGMLDTPIDHSEVMETGAQVAATFRELLKRIIRNIH